MDTRPSPTGSGASPSEADRSHADLLHRALNTLLSRAGMVGLSVAASIALARALDPAARGNLAVLQSLAGVGAVVANFAIAKAVVHHTGKRLLRPEAAVVAAGTVGMASSVLAFAVLLPVVLVLRGRLLPGVATGLLVLTVVLAGFLLTREYLSGILLSTGRAVAYVGASALQPLGLLVCLVVFALFGRISLAGAAAAWGVGVVCSAAATLWIAVRATSTVARPRWSEMLSLARFGVRAYPALLATFLNLRLDQIVVRLVASAAVVGQYAVAVGVGEVLIRLPAIMLWALTGALSSSDPETGRLLVARISRWTIVVVGGAATVIAVLAPTLLPLIFGAEYQPAVGSVLLLLPGMVCYAPAAVIAEYLIVQRGAPLRAASVAGVSLVVSTVLDVWLAPRWGAAGASVASSVSYAAMLAVALRELHRHTGMGLVAIWPRWHDVRDVASALRRTMATESKR